jgi:hypothetical protein
MIYRSIRLLLALAVIATLGACASGVTRMDSAAAPGAPASAAVSSGPVKSVSLALSEDAKKLVADNATFNPDALRTTIERVLQAQNLVKSDAPQTLDVEVTSFRVRSSFSAVMFGFMAGSDNVEGVVTIKDAEGRVIKRALVKASYALGGLGGGQDDARMNWLYEEFAKHALAEVTGQPAK